MKKEVIIEGKKGVKATVLADSISPGGVRMLSYELEYPRIILAELNTHRMLPKNSHSSRAIPFLKMVEQLTGEPVRFGAANVGMQDKGYHHNGIVLGDMQPTDAWNAAKENAIHMARAFFEAGYHKQVYNRLTEPFQMMRTVLSGTEYANFFWLRYHEAADPTLQELARVMYTAQELSEPQVLHPGEWHLPYVHTERHGGSGERLYFLNSPALWDEALTLEEAIKVSAARSAAVSFRNEDYGLEKCLEVHDRLVGDERKHASAFEHQATPMFPNNWGAGGATCNVAVFPDTWQEGVSHMTRDRKLWSGPLCGWVQYRKLIPGENYAGPF